MKTVAEYMKEEAELLRRRVVHATRPKRPLTMDEARELHEAMLDSSVFQYVPKSE